MYVSPATGAETVEESVRLLSSLFSNLPTNIVPTNIAWLKLSGKFLMGMIIPPL